MQRHIPRLLRPLLLVAFLLVGCDSTSTVAPLSLDELPLPAELTLYEGAYEVPLDSMVQATRLAYQTSEGESEWNYYQLPSYQNWEAVTAFYQEALASSGWQAETTAASSPLVWTRQSRSGEQVLVITLLPFPATPNESYLVMQMLVTP